VPLESAATRLVSPHQRLHVGVPADHQRRADHGRGGLQRGSVALLVDELADRRL
jgi:hypothetical protein